MSEETQRSSNLTKARAEIDEILALAEAAVVTEGRRGAELGWRAIELSTSGLFADRPYLAGRLRGLRAVCEGLMPIGEYEQAACAAEELLERIQRESEDQDMRRYPLAVLGAVRQQIGDVDRAEELIREALRISESVNDVTQQSICWEHLSFVATAREDRAEALRCLRKSLLMRRRIGDHLGIAYALNNLAMAEIEAGIPEVAASYAQDSLSLIRAHRITRLQAPAIDTLGQAFLAMGQIDRAVELFRQAVALEQELSSPFGEASVLTSLGAVLCRSESTILEGLARLEDACAILERIGAKAQLSDCLRELSMGYERHGNLPKALESLRRHHELELGLSRERADERLEILRRLCNAEHSKK